VRVDVARGAEEQRRGVDGAGGDDHDVGAVALQAAFAIDDDARYGPAGGIRLEPLDLRVREERQVLVVERRLDGTDLRVCLAVHEAREAVEARAADAGAAARVLL